MSATLSRTKAILAIAAAVLLSSGCGGGAESALVLLAGGVGAGGTGIGIVRGIGVITGFGSLIVDGVRRDDSTASYMSEEDHGAATAMAPTGAMLGQRLEYAQDANGAMSSVLISPEMVGTVTAASTSGITVLGIRVTTNADTALGPVTSLIGYASPADIQIGDRVAVYGMLKTDAQGTSSLQATLIVPKIAGTGTRLTGHVSRFNAATGVFAIGANTINAGSAVISPMGAPLGNGQLVTVWSDTPPVANVITAGNIRIKWPPADSGDRVLSGPISAYAGTADFKVLNASIDASSAAIAPAGATLGDGIYVVVAGQFDAAANKLAASKVTVYAPAAGDAVALRGTILNFVSPSSFTVRGVVVDASTAKFSGGTARDLANNVFVEVAGAIQNNVVRAGAVTFEAINPMQAPRGAVLDLEGTIESYDPRTGAYALRLESGQNVMGNMAGTVFYEQGNATDLAVGQSVALRGMLGVNSLMTSVIRFSSSGPAPAPGNPPDAASTHLEGIVYNLTNSSFMVNGITVYTNGVSVQGGGMMGLRQGQRVRVDVVISDGKYLATAIRMGGR